VTVIKVIEIIGESTKSWEDAAKNAVKTATKTLRGLIGIDVINMTATIKDGKIAKYRSTVKIAFKFES
jgi:flavin-binding protein dodecin